MDAKVAETVAEPEAQETEAPMGFQQSDTDVDQYPPWEFTRGPLIGTVIKVKTVEVIRRGEAVDVQMAVVEDKQDERWLLWESANLGNFFGDIDAGMEVHVTHTGKVDLGGGRSMNTYRACYR